VVAFPTETVYGLGAIATYEEAVRRIFYLKGRPTDNPLIVHVSDLSQVYDLVTEVPEKARKVMEVFGLALLVSFCKQKRPCLWLRAEDWKAWQLECLLILWLYHS